MRILLDESLPKDLALFSTVPEFVTVRASGWSGVKNGKLLALALASARFDVFVTADRHLEFQQNLATLPISVVVLRVRRTRIETIQPLLPELLKLLDHLPGKVLRHVGVETP